MRTLDDLEPDEFENLTFDLVSIAGLRNVVWRTPGADGGRDIEGDYSTTDFSGERSIQKWYVECKRYSSSIDWPTVWKKISYADSNGADFLLMVTNNNPSPNCETEIAKWNVGRRSPQVRLWRGYRVDQILKAYPAIGMKYGLRTAGNVPDVEFLPLLTELMKISQASYTAIEFGGDPVSGLEVASSMSELISLRMDQLRRIGWISTVEELAIPPRYSWLDWKNLRRRWDSAGMAAFLSAFRHYLGAARVVVEEDQECAVLTSINARAPITPTTEDALTKLAIWANIEIQSFDRAGGRVTVRTRILA